MTMKLYILVSNFILALCISCISYTISRSGIFSGFRNWVERKMPDKIDELIHCPYCLSHYVALIVLLITRTIIPITGWIVVDFIITLFALIEISSICHSIMLWGYVPVAESESYRLRNKAKNKEQV